MPSNFLRAAAVAAAAILPAWCAAQPLSFDQALSLAAQRSEAARAARAAALGADESARAAGQLPDPMLRAGIENLPVTGAERWRTAVEPMTMKRIGISQEWLAADKRAAREGAARAMAQREAAQGGVAEGDARLQAAQAYLEAWYAEAALRLAAQTEHHLHEELEAARARWAGAAGAAAEVLQLDAARGMAQDESDEARQQQASALVALARWVGFRPESIAPPPSLTPPSEADYVARHPAVVALRSEAELARRNAAVARHERSANWTWELAYGQRAGYPDLVSFGVSIPLQIAPARRQDREIAAKLALVDQAEAELAEATRAATAQYQALAGDADRLRQRLQRYERAVVAPAGRRTAAALAAYRSNQASLAALFDARHMEVEVQRKLLALQRELDRAQVELALKPLAQGGAR
ncbi:TolC family protein [Caldimonas sp. KR1-144]|uniref:TolC family protein n=1 Tax=Caldimonas sp. KR1-144 TaxID=3400911 RepID=UPI003C05D191